MRLRIEDREQDNPAYVRLMNTGSMTPLAARALAQALTEAAQMAEETTAGRTPFVLPETETEEVTA